MWPLLITSTTGGPKRLDYIIDYDDIITDDNGTVSLQWFRIKNEGLFMVTANNGRTSQVYKWSRGRKALEPYQQLPTHSAMRFKYIVIGNQVFICLYFICIFDSLVECKILCFIDENTI